MASVEDHGYIIDIGINGTKAFLPKKATKDQHSNQEGKRGLPGGGWSQSAGSYTTCILY